MTLSIEDLENRVRALEAQLQIAEQALITLFAYAPEPLRNMNALRSAFHARHNGRC